MIFILDITNYATFCAYEHKKPDEIVFDLLTFGLQRFVSWKKQDNKNEKLDLCHKIFIKLFQNMYLVKLKGFLMLTFFNEFIVELND